MNPDVTAIIVTFESAAVIGACLAALARENVAAIIVDNASQDASAEIARAAGATVIVNARNEGFGRAMNIGMRAATTRFGLILNPDAAVQPGAIAALLAGADRYADAGILGPRILDGAGEIFFPLQSHLSPYLKNERKIRWNPEGDVCIPFLSGACYLIDRNLFLSLGGFDENIFLFSEDTDLCRRVIDMKFSVVYIHDAVVSHTQGKSSAPAKGRRYKTRWHFAWSQAYVARKYGLPNPAYGIALRNGLKLIPAMLSGDSGKVERYRGAFDGAIAFLRGDQALAREGLS